MLNQINFFYIKIFYLLKFQEFITFLIKILYDIMLDVI
jgi:hypothetical protein